MRHLFRLDVLVKLLTCQKIELNRRLSQRDALLVSVLGDLGGVVVADVRVERRHEHQRVSQVGDFKPLSRLHEFRCKN